MKRSPMPKRSKPMKRTPMPRTRNALRRTQRPSGARRDVQATDTYADLRRGAERRAGGSCEANLLHAPTCDGTGNQAHHIWPRQHGGPDELWNLMWVHPDCHLGQIHGRPHQATQLGYLARHGDWANDQGRRSWE